MISLPTILFLNSIAILFGLYLGGTFSKGRFLKFSDLVLGNNKVERMLYKKHYTFRQRFHNMFTGVTHNDINYFLLDNPNLEIVPEVSNISQHTKRSIYRNYAKDYNDFILHLFYFEDEITSAEYIVRARFHLSNLKRVGYRPSNSDIQILRNCEEKFRLTHAHTPSPLGWKSDREETIDMVKKLERDCNFSTSKVRVV